RTRVHRHPVLQPRVTAVGRRVPPADPAQGRGSRHDDVDVLRHAFPLADRDALAGDQVTAERLSWQVVRGRMPRLQHPNEVVGVGHDDTAVAQHGPPPHPLRPWRPRVVPDRLLPGTGYLRTRTGHGTILAAL